MKDILVVALHRNRGWLLPTWLEHIRQQDFDLFRCRFVFLVNDSDDDTGKQLRDYRGFDIELMRHDLGPAAKGHDSSRITSGRQELYGNLVILRNMLLDQWHDETHLISIDSDILVEPHTFETFTASETDYTAAMVINNYSICPEISVLLNRGNEKRRAINAGFLNPFSRLMEYHLNAKYVVDWSGACFCIKRSLKNVRFEHHHAGEDVGYCRQLKRGQIALNTSMVPFHVQERGLLIEYPKFKAARERECQCSFQFKSMV